MNLLVNIDFESELPLYKQLSQSIIDAISSGRLKAGDRVPPTRELARQLNLSRVTVLKCYKELLSRGHFEAGHGLGTRVSRHLPDEAKQTRQKFLSFEPNDTPEFVAKPSRFAERLSAAHVLLKNTNGVVQSAELPVRQWQQCVIRSTRTLDPDKFSSQNEPFGYRPLRESIAKVLNRSRAIACEVDQIIVCSDRTRALDLITRLLIDRGQIVAVENPGDAKAKSIYQSNGARIFPVSVDDQGLVVHQLETQSEFIKLIHTTPSHQNPTGATLTMDRRIQLIKWARQKGSIILEDDYDCLFRFGGQSTAAIRGIDDSECVIYLADLTNLMHPFTNSAFIVIPKHLVEIFAAAQHLLCQQPPMVESLALTEFVNNGMFDMHLRNVRDTLQKRRQALMYSLAINFRNLVQVSRSTTSLNVLVRFNDEHLSDQAYLECARDAGMSMMSTGECYVDCPRQGEFLITFAHTDAEILSRQVAQMASLVASYEPDLNAIESDLENEIETENLSNAQSETDFSVHHLQETDFVAPIDSNVAVLT